MSAASDSAGTTGSVAGAAALSLDQRVGRAYAVELRKLAAQTVVRLLLVLAVAGPFAFAAVLRVASSTPGDAVFGTEVRDSGFAVALVVLSFAGNWGAPIIAGLIAGDIFSGEDRHNTWKTILTRSCSLGDLFVAKALAAATVTCALVGVAGAASIVAGVVLAGAHGLVGLSGQSLSAGQALWLTVAAWACCELPALSFAAIGLLFSITSRNGVVGVVGPVVAALATQLLNLVGQGVWVHLLLPGSTFFYVFGLFAAPAFGGPLLVTAGAALAWAVVATGAAWLVLRRRDFLGGGGAGSGRAAGWRRPLQVALATAVVVGVLAALTGAGPLGVTRPRVQRSVASTFSNVSLLQQRRLGRIAPPGARLAVRPFCIRRGTASRGPGDWTCEVYVYLPQPRAIPFTRTDVEYDVSVDSDGCYKAQSPPNFIGGQTMTDARGRQVTNPLFVVYGCFDPLG